MKTKTSGVGREKRSDYQKTDGTNWMLIAGGALLSSLSIRLGYKLKQAMDSKQQCRFDPNPNHNHNHNHNHNPNHSTNSASCRRTPSNLYSFTEDDFTCLSALETTTGAEESEGALPLVVVSSAQIHNNSNGSADSPCVSESGSDVFTKRQVIQKLRQQLKRRDDMMMEMQDQIAELQGSASAQLARSAHLESQLDAANRELFDSEREIQRLRKAIADHCVGHADSDGGVEMLRRQVRELKEVIEGKDYLIQSYKEQKSELSLKINDLQRRLDSQLPNIL